MPKHHFDFNRHNQFFSIDPTGISGFGGQTNPYLRVPISFDMSPAQLGSDEEIQFILTSIEANLTFDGFENKATETSKICNIEVNRRIEDWHFFLDFPLDQYRLFTIEQNRKENLYITFNATFHFGTYTAIKVEIPGNKFLQTKNFISQFGNSSSTVNIEITQSHWIKNILPKLGFQSFKLIELPLRNDIIPNEFQKSIKELVEAEKYFKFGDYDKTVAHCRSALDPFKEKMKELKQFISSNSEFDWIEETTKATYAWLDVLFKKTNGITSKPHHPPSMGHFDRNEAEIIYLITTGIVAYISRIKTQ